MMTRNTGVGAVTSPHPASVYNNCAHNHSSLSLTVGKVVFSFCLFFPNILPSDIQYFFGPSGAS